jgi:hypothetical protein
LRKYINVPYLLEDHEREMGFGSFGSRYGQKAGWI